MGAKRMNPAQWEDLTEAASGMDGLHGEVRKLLLKIGTEMAASGTVAEDTRRGLYLLAELIAETRDVLQDCAATAFIRSAAAPGREAPAQGARRPAVSRHLHVLPSPLPAAAGWGLTRAALPAQD